MNKLTIIGCIHVGHKYHNRELLKEYLKNDGEFLVVGDMIECGIPQKANKMMEQDSVPQDQAEEVIKLLYPIRQRIVGMCTSNHSNRVWEAVGVDIDKMIARELGVHYVTMMGQVKWHNKKIGFHHGFGGGMNEWSDAQKVLTSYPDSDIVAVSHRHRLATTNFRNSLGGHTHRVDFVRTGSFIKHARYADMAAYQPTSNGAAIVTLKDNKVYVDVSGEQ